MSCELERTNLHGYLDGELDATGAAEFERHLETCHECSESLGAAESLRTALKNGGLYERAPERVREVVRAGLTPAPAGVENARMSRPAWHWVAIAAVVLLAAAVAWFALPPRFPVRPFADVSAAELVDAHIRSLQPGHLTDVASTDQHTVKPWFDGKLDFVPPVKDYGDQGFPLIGGRLDVLGGRSVAVLVYGRRKHIINVFVWTTKEADASARTSEVYQGYQWVYWRHGGMEYCAVSDVSSTDLKELAQLFVE